MVCQHTTIEALDAPYVQFGPSIVLSVPQPQVMFFYYCVGHSFNRFFFKLPQPLVFHLTYLLIHQPPDGVNNPSSDRIRTGIPWSV